jgi:hypothetical protein
MLIQIAIHVLLFQHCLAHISWLFPEARWPHFDYTNTRDNVPPCGLASSKNGKFLFEDSVDGYCRIYVCFSVRVFEAWTYTYSFKNYKYLTRN